MIDYSLYDGFTIAAKGTLWVIDKSMMQMQMSGSISANSSKLYVEEGYF